MFGAFASGVLQISMPTSPKLTRRFARLWTLIAVMLLCIRTVSAQVVFSEIHYHPVEDEAYNADGTPER